MTNLCLDVPTSGTPNMGKPVVQDRCGAGGEHLQYFDLVPATGNAGQFALRPAGSALCVVPPEHGVPAPSQVGLYPCDLTDGDNHLWRLQWNDIAGFMLVNVKSDGTPTPMCLDVPGHGDSIPGLRLGVHPCHPDPGDDHWWAFT
ncbi:RICIN domain-containing protein [Kitasatospora sp. NPDC089913]|uniref:RICIN domain-containing protein n=1 Tax=Kitasatospora sp. NPDC089913 TaxID=3364080 RepID=UPI0037FB7283